MLSLQNLRAFIAVAETGEIRGAAQQLSRTPSAISMALKQIENEIGAPLFERGRKSRLTSLGSILFSEGRNFLDHYQRLMANVVTSATRERTSASIACLPSVAVTFLPKLIEELACERPAVHLQVRDMDSRSVREAVGSGAVDLGIGTFRDSSPDLKFTALYSDKLSLLCRTDSKLIRRKSPIAWRDLAGEPFLAHGGYGTIKDPEFFALVERAHTHLPNVMSLFALVKAGLGVTVLPRSFELQADRDIRFLPLKDPNAHQTVGLIARNDRRMPPAAERFVQALTKMLRRDHRKLRLLVNARGPSN